MDLKEKISKALNEGFDGIVVYEEIEGDLDTPVSILAKLLDEEKIFLLESAKEDKTYSRFSFIGFSFGSHITIKTRQDLARFKKLKVYQTENLGSFKGGYVGYFPFEAVELFDVLRKPLNKKPKNFGVFFEVNEFLVYDNYTNRLYLGMFHEFNKNETLAFNLSALTEKLKNFKAKFKEKSSKNIAYFKQTKAKIIGSMFSQEEFENSVKHVKELIEEGEAIQVVLSNYYLAENINPFEFYRNLRRINPSPYMFFFKYKDFYLAGSSPEIHLRIRNRIATIRPIAGTRPKGENLEKIKKELFNDEKERAEHLMLVDLARNDLARVSKPAAVTVTSFMQPEVYSHVIHLTSNVEADLDTNTSPIEVVSNTFPAGTLSGAPKVRAIEIIDEIEKHPREAYGGCVGYIGFDGDLDLAITIRTAIFENNTAKLQAGAGIVYDSNPHSEYLETINKLKALLKAGGINSDTLN
ncbi:anthranilate synthase component I family protein [Hippea alviniae]|uniref:anthranilate synthase component I family protein n=1 Tax=Hippea alviniae TaxID=1279027 RepID=UPI0003B77F20|nr:anthranilate synthase component I family protein [Hippea alviniae]